jgi:hypothetical protein
LKIKKQNDRPNDRNNLRKTLKVELMEKTLNDRIVNSEEVTPEENERGSEPSGHEEEEEGMQDRSELNQVIDPGFNRRRSIASENSDNCLG